MIVSQSSWEIWFLIPEEIRNVFAGVVLHTRRPAGICGCKWRPADVLALPSAVTVGTREGITRRSTHS